MFLNNLVLKINEDIKLYIFKKKMTFHPLIPSNKFSTSLSFIYFFFNLELLDVS